MITLYGHPMSRAYRVMWMLKELKLPFRHVPTGFLDGATHQPDYLRINPNGRVPALVDGDLTLCESLAINLYLAKRYGGPLAPQDLREDAMFTQWSMWVVTEIEKPLILAAANLFLFEPGERSREEAQVMLGKLSRPFGVLESHLSERTWLVGDRFSAADLNVSSVMTLLPLAGIDIDAWPRLKVWLWNCLERPAAEDWKPISFRVPRPPSMLGMLKVFV